MNKKQKRAAGLLAVLLLLAYPAKVFFIHFPALMPKLPPCPSIALFKIYCPGCGSTRALYCLSNGNIAGVFANNPLLPWALLLATIIYIDPEFSIRHPRLITAFTTTTIVFMILRNLPWYPFTLLAPAGI